MRILDLKESIEEAKRAHRIPSSHDFLAITRDEIAAVKEIYRGKNPIDFNNVVYGEKDNTSMKDLLRILESGGFPEELTEIVTSGDISKIMVIAHIMRALRDAIDYFSRHRMKEKTALSIFKTDMVDRPNYPRMLDEAISMMVQGATMEDLDDLLWFEKTMDSRGNPMGMTSFLPHCESIEQLKQTAVMQMSESLATVNNSLRGDELLLIGNSAPVPNIQQYLNTIFNLGPKAAKNRINWVQWNTN